ncbi:hypothetical protein ACF3NX_14500 (plasmid) [Acetobacter orientalis]|uniref:hypothetical protein n=1 Tax=Acetobacter orientalis TaxID=146474 RepID=UPI00386FF5F5
MKNLFNAEVVKTISDWQRGATSPEIKLARASALKDVFLGLPEYFRQCDALCFRQECHQKDRTFQVLIEDKLPEVISSWTTDLEIAKTFKGGVVWGEEDRSIILAIKPPTGSVVANLERLYNEPEFQEAVALYGPKIPHFYNGAGKYGNDQREVLLDLDSLSSTSIYSYGGYSSPVDSLIAGFKEMYDCEPNEEEIAQIVQKANQPWWLSETGTKNVITRVLPKFVDRVTNR